MSFDLENLIDNHPEAFTLVFCTVLCCTFCYLSESGDKRQEVKEKCDFTEVYKSSNEFAKCSYNVGICDYTELKNVKLVKKYKNKDGSYTVVIKGSKGDGNELIKHKKIYSNVQPSKSDICKDLIADDNGNLKCVKGTQTELPVKTMKEQIKETERKSELKSVTPEELVCAHTYFGAVYKDGVCILPPNYEHQVNRGLERDGRYDLGACQIQKIVPGKDKISTVTVNCQGVPATIKVKSYNTR